VWIYGRPQKRTYLLILRKQCAAFVSSRDMYTDDVVLGAKPAADWSTETTPSHSARSAPTLYQRTPQIHPSEAANQ